MWGWVGVEGEGAERREGERERGRGGGEECVRQKNPPGRGKKKKR